MSPPKAVTTAKRVKRLDEPQSHEPVDEKLKKAELEELEREKVHIQMQRMCNNDTFTFSSAKAALFLGVKPDEKIPASKVEAATHSKNEHIAHMARFAKTMSGFHH